MTIVIKLSIFHNFPYNSDSTTPNFRNEYSINMNHENYLFIFTTFLLIRPPKFVKITLFSITLNGIKHLLRGKEVLLLRK